MDTLGQRIKKLRKEQKYTQVVLGKAVGVSGVTVGYWEKDLNQPGGMALSKLARVLRTTENYLLYGQTNSTVAPTPNAMQFIPLLSWEEATAFTTSGASEMPTSAKKTTTFLNVSPLSFGFIIDDDTMVNPHGNPSIPRGSTVVVDPLVEPENGKIVVAVIVDNSGPHPKKVMTVKKLVIDGPNRYLSPLNSRYDSIPVTENCKIIGVIKGVQFEL
ncbi:LexA family protein [Yersinia enterocolitica]|nr:helix-turn-helix domain-containing protein [Yersinia enterocolitica]HDL8438323.1 helix-turn-helix domain-containing protein [Yersinia enterocolitica]HDM8456706.1 helix-turn-helix domain-containing protein [Yersinia enterocolitica]HDW8047753.1 helix-turn-helix domain-containing protein [Yersinia enterocolitica]HEF9705869.1 helix-turn-helix domain-containing protein [Yersinia enterocolitica]